MRLRAARSAVLAFVVSSGCGRTDLAASAAASQLSPAQTERDAATDGAERGDPAATGDASAGDSQAKTGEPDAGPGERDAAVDATRVSDALCDGPFRERTSPRCDMPGPGWGVYSGVGTLEACFVLCAEQPGCRAAAQVDYSHAQRSCILHGDCTPSLGDHRRYVALGGCTAPTRCWTWREQTRPEDLCGDDGPSDWSLVRDGSLGRCIARCERHEESCGQYDRVDFDRSTGRCMFERSCVQVAASYATFWYQDVPCP